MMIKFKSVLFSFAIIALLNTSCKEAKKVDEGETTKNTTETSSDSAKVEVTKKTTMAAVLNANLATEEDLKGIGIPTAIIEQILEKRPFLSMAGFDALFGPDVDKVKLYQKVFVPFNLNTTDEDDFKMIPGVGDRMAHEFEEYRPYISIAQFRREIGKYVDKDEVARYENYVFVPIELNTATEEAILQLPGVGKRMAHEFEEYRPYKSMEQFRKEIGKYVDDKELARLERLVYIKQ